MLTNTMTVSFNLQAYIVLISEPTFIHLQGQLTGASMNPARSFAPAIWNGAWDNHWIYWAGPMAAALVTSVIYKYAFRREVEDLDEVDETTMSTKRTSEAELA